MKNGSTGNCAARYCCSCGTKHRLQKIAPQKKDLGVFLQLSTILISPKGRKPGVAV